MTNDLSEICKKISSFFCGLDQNDDCRILIFFDNLNRDLAEAFKSLYEQFKIQVAFQELPYKKKLNEFPQEAILQAKKLENKDLIIILSSGNLIFNCHLHSVFSPFKKLNTVKSRSFYLPPFPKESLIRILSADFQEYIEYEKTLLNAFYKSRNIRILAQNGTDITLKIRDFVVTPYQCLEPSSHALFHFGEISSAIYENSSEGTIVYDTDLSMGKLCSKLILDVKEGKIMKYTIESKEDPVIEEFLDVLNKSDDNAKIIAELGIGINPKAVISGFKTENESVRGTCHLDLGDNIIFGGSNKSNFHGGGCINKPTIISNDETIIKNGNYIHRR